LLRAYAQMRRHIPGTVLALVGKGPRFDYIKKLARDMGIADGVRFLGYHVDTLPAVYNSFHIKVLLQGGNDGSCRAMLEAMACGVPVLGAARGAMSATIDSGQNGFLVEEPQKVDCLAHALKEALLKEREDLHRMGDDARLKAEANYGEDRFCQRMLNYYNQMIHKDFDGN